MNPRGEDSSPEDYWTVNAIRGHSFYKVLSSRSPVANIVNLNDAKCLQDLALAQDMTRGVILDSIFKQVDRLGNISIDLLQHYVTKENKVKYADKVSDKDKAEAVGPLLPLKRIVYKDNDDGMMWGTTSISVSPILNDTHHLDQTVYDRIQWLADLMQDSQPGSDAKVKDFFVNAVHISGDNYDKMKASVIKQAASLKQSGFQRYSPRSRFRGHDEENLRQGCGNRPARHADSRQTISSGDYLVRWPLGKGADNLPADVMTIQGLLASRCGQVASSPD